VTIRSVYIHCFWMKNTPSFDHVGNRIDDFICPFDKGYYFCSHRSYCLSLETRWCWITLVRVAPRLRSRTSGASWGWRHSLWPTLLMGLYPSTGLPCMVRITWWRRVDMFSFWFSSSKLYVFVIHNMYCNIYPRYLWLCIHMFEIVCMII